MPVQFICPHCSDTLRVPDRHIGERGRCKKCGGRIALVVPPEAVEPYTASPIVETVAPAPEARPATEAQRQYLHDLGAPVTAEATLDRERASEQIDDLKRQRDRTEGPTKRQIDWLRQLGMDEARLAAIQSKAEASELIDTWEPPPTENQLKYLTRLGVSETERASLRSRSEAANLIELRLRDGQSGY